MEKVDLSDKDITKLLAKVVGGRVYTYHNVTFSHHTLLKKYSAKVGDDAPRFINKNRLVQLLSIEHAKLEK